MTDKKEKKYSLEEKLKYKIPYKWKIQSFTKDGSKAQTDLDRQVIHKRALLLKYSQKKNDDQFVKEVIQSLF